jgi:glutamate-1-semialdehyde 2,1-aminomutase
MSSSRSQDLSARGAKVIPATASNMGAALFRGRYAREAKGAYVVDLDGRRYLDFIHNWTANVHGHAHPVIVEAASRAIASGLPTSMSCEAELELAELLCGRIKSCERVKFNNSGMAAGMMAVKAARAFTGRDRIAKVEGAYHGNYDGLEVSSFTPAPATWGDAEAPAKVPLSAGTARSVLDDVLILPFCDTEATERLLRAHGPSLAAVFVDLNAWRGGIVPLAREHVAMLRRVTREIGALLVLDEVISLRLDSGGAQARYDDVADLTMMGKIIGGGLPSGRSAVAPTSCRSSSRRSRSTAPSAPTR